MTDWRNRIVGHGEQPADQFTANPRNPRRHPQKQRDAVAGSLATLGWIAPVIVNKRTGYVIDGHERIFQALVDNADVPYVEVDLSEDEEALALATFDWITYLAEYDRDILDDLLREVNTDDASLQAVIAELADSVGLYSDEKELPDLLMPTMFNVLIECDSEQTQVQTLQTLSEMGYTCRALIS